MPQVPEERAKQYYLISFQTTEYLAPNFGNILTCPSATTEQLKEFKTRPSYRELSSWGLNKALRTIKAPKYVLEMGIRMLSECEVDMSISSFTELMTLLATNEQFGKPLRGRAYSLLAFAYYNLAYHKRARPADELPRVKDIVTAAHYANKAAELDFWSLAMVAIGRTLVERGHRRSPQDSLAAPREGQSIEDHLCWAAGFAPFWNGFDRRQRGFDRRVSVKPEDERVACTAGCGIVASRRSAMSKCAGRCPPQFKPLYCSKSCQRLDWRRHRAVCRGDARQEDLFTLPAPSYTDDEVLASLPQEPPEAMAMMTEHDMMRHIGMTDIPGANGWTTEFFIDVPRDNGEVVRMYSHGLCADQMKRMKVLAQRSADSNVYIMRLFDAPSKATSEFLKAREGGALVITRVRLGCRYEEATGKVYHIYPSTKFNMQTMRTETTL